MNLTSHPLVSNSASTKFYESKVLASTKEQGCVVFAFYVWPTKYMSFGSIGAVTNDMISLFSLLSSVPFYVCTFHSSKFFNLNYLNVLMPLIQWPFSCPNKP